MDSARQNEEGTALRGHERSHGSDAEELVRDKDGGLGLSFLTVEIRPPHHHRKRLSSSTRSGRFGQKGSSIPGAAYLWDLHHGEDKEHLRCGEFDGPRRSEVDGAVPASRTGTAAGSHQ